MGREVSVITELNLLPKIYLIFLLLIAPKNLSFAQDMNKTFDLVSTHLGYSDSLFYSIKSTCDSYNKTGKTKIDCSKNALIFFKAAKSQMLTEFERKFSNKEEIKYIQDLLSHNLMQRLLNFKTDFTRNKINEKFIENELLKTSKIGIPSSYAPKK